jgi:putative oxidoreductase
LNPLANRLFAPEAGTRAMDFALLVLRLWLGLTMLFNHGLGKLINFGDMSSKFLDLFGIGSTASLALAVFAEVFCSALLAAGLVTRFAGLNLAITMLVAFAMVHKMALSGESSGELAFIYLAGYVTLLIAGPGRYSADRFFFSKPTKPFGVA